MVKDFSDYSLKGRNTFGMDVKCRRFIEFSTVGELQQTVTSLTEADKPLLFLGGGSNILFTKDYGGTVLHSAIMGHEATGADGGVLLRCGSGETWNDIVDLCVSNGWYGTENLARIPGEVGASAVQNIGAYGVEAKDIIHEVEAVDARTGELRTFSNAECGYSYRWSKFKGEWRNQFVITHVTYKLSTTFAPRLDYGNITAELGKKGIGGRPTAAQLRDVITEIRDAKLPDPKKEGNAGSFFTNPVVTREKYGELAARFGAVPHYAASGGRVKIPAAWMIEQCGWKGKTLGPAGVHPRQALVLVNRGGACGSDILRLCHRIREDVKSKFGIEISPEVNII